MSKMASFLSSVTSYIQPMSRTTVLVSVAAVTTVTLLAAAKLLYKRRETRKDAATVTRLTIYPIKSVPGIQVDHMEITYSCAKYGDFYDRSMVLLNGENRMITLRQHGSLATIKTSISGPSQLTLKADSMEDLVIDVSSDSPVKGQIIRFSVWGSPTAGFEVSPEASSWFSRFLKEPGVRLVKFTSKCKNRPTQVAGSKGSYLVDKYPIRYQDGSPVHLCNETTLDELNVIAQPDGKKFVMLAFRPNITVKSPIPKEELSWYSCTIDSVTFNNVRACTRCAVPTVDVLTGERDPDKTKLMFNHRSAQDEYERKNYSKNPMFGINLVPQKTGRINLGSSVDVCI